MSDNLEIKLPVNSDDLVKADDRARKLITTTDKVMTSLNQLQKAVFGPEVSTKGVADLRKEVLALGKEVGPVSETISKHLSTSLDRLEKDAAKYRSIIASEGREKNKPGTFAADMVKGWEADKNKLLVAMGQMMNSLNLGIQTIRNQTAAGIAEQAAAIAKSVDAAEDAGKRMKKAEQGKVKVLNEVTAQVEDALKERQALYQKYDPTKNKAGALVRPTELNEVTAQVRAALMERAALYQTYDPIKGKAGRLVQPLQEPTTRKQELATLQKDYDALAKRGEVFTEDMLRRLKVAGVSISATDRLRLDSMNKTLAAEDAAEKSRLRALANTTKFEAEQLALREANWRKLESGKKVSPVTDVNAAWAEFEKTQTTRVQTSTDALWKAKEAADRKGAAEHKKQLASEIAGWGEILDRQNRVDSAAQKLALEQRKSAELRTLNEVTAQVRAALMERAALYQTYDPIKGKAGRLVQPLQEPTPPIPKPPKPSDIDPATTSFNKLSRAIWDSHSAVRGLASGFGLLWLTWGSTLPLLAGAIASFSVVKSFKVGTELERSMFEITNLAGLGATEAGKLKDTLLDLGKTSTYTATQAAEAAKILSLAGLKGAEVQAALVPTLRFASSGGVTMERAAEVLTSVGEAYAYSANAYSTVSDIIVKASSDSIASVEDMAEAFKTSSVLAQSYGVSLTDTAFALESLANIGIKGSAAGTSYRNFVTELTRADGKAAAMMKAIGVTALDSTGQLRPLLDITRDLTAATINLSGSEQRKVQDALANERGGKLYAATQAVLSKELKTSQQATLDEAAAMQASGRVKEAQALRVKAVANAYEILSKRQKESVDNAAGLTFFADLEKKVTTGGMFQGVQASLSSQLAKAFEAAQPALNSFAISLRETINSEQFKNDLSAIATTLAELGKAALDAAKWLYEHKEAVLLAGAAYVGLPAVIAAITAGVGFWTGGMVTLTASITAAKVAAVSNFQQIAGVLTGVTSAIGAAGTFAALQATAMTAAVVALGVAAAVAAGTLAAAGVAYLLFGDSAAAATRKVLEAEMKLSKDKAASLEAQIKSTNDGLAAEIEGTKAAIKEKEKGTAAGEIATRVMGAQAVARVNAYWDEIGVLARKNLELEKHNILLKGGDWYQTADAESRYNKQAISDLQDRNRAVSSLEGRISTLVKLKRQEAKLDMEASERNRKHEQGGDKGPKSETNKFGARLPTPFYDLKEFASNVAALGKAELDALKNSRTAKLAELKDYHDAGLLSIGNYEAQVISVTEAGYKAEAAKLEENLTRELAELDNHEDKILDLYGRRSEELKKEFGKDANKLAEEQGRLDDQVIDRLNATHGKQLAATAEFNTSKAKMRQDADDAERNATIKHAKDLLAIRAKVAEAIAASQDRVAGMREEAEVANRTAGLSGPELEAVQARLKVEIDGRKTLRTLDNALTTERQRATDILALYERETDAETRLIQWQAYVDANEKINTLLDGRSKLEVTLGNEAAEAYALAYDKAFKKIADGIAENLSGGIVDALFTGGKEGAKKLRDTLKKELLMKPFQMVIQAMIQPYAKSVAGAITNTMYGGKEGGGLGSMFSGGASGGGLYGSFATSSLGQSLGLAEASWYGAEVGLTSLGQSIGAATSALGQSIGAATSALGAALPYIGAITSVLSIISSMDDSGTIHTGGLAQYSATGGTQTSTQHGAFGMGFGGVDFGQGGTDLAVNMAKSVVGILDSTAVAFGKTAGYTAATAFADDTSQDGAWGGLLIQKLGETVLNWDDARTSRWAPREFADGEAGAKEYAAAVAKDVRDLLIEQTPDWADTMLNALGDAPTLEQLVGTISQINEVVVALKAMGQASEAFAGMAESAFVTLVAALGGAQSTTAKLGSYYGNFYSEEERIALSTKALTADMAAFGKVMPATRDEFRGMVDAAIAGGDTTLAANLLNVADRFAAVTPAVEASTEAMDEFISTAEGAAERFLSGDTLKNFKLDRITLKLNEALGTAFSAVDLGNMDVSQIKAAVLEFVNSGAAPAAKTAVIQVGEALLDLKEQAKELENTLLSTADSLADKFLSGDVLKSFKLNRLATQINEAAGTAFTSLDLDAIGIEPLKQMVLAYAQNAAIAPEARIAVMQLSAALVDMKQEALDAADAAAQIITDQRLGLERQLLTVNGDTVALRALDLAALDSSNRALQEHIWAMEDAKVAAEKAAAAERARADQQLSLQLQIANLSGDTAAIRAHELSLLDGDMNQALQKHIWLLEDQKTATEAATAAAEKNAEALRTSTDNAYSALERAVAAQRKVIETQREAAQSLVQEVTAVFDTLKTNVADLFGEVEDARRFQAAQGRAFITAAITGAKAGAGLPDSNELGEAISAARAGLNDTVFASQAESDFQRLVLANELKTLQSLSGDQLSEAERQLKLAEDQLTSLDATLETAKSQLDALRGIDTSVISVQAAIDRLGLAMAAEKAGAPAAVQAATEVASTVTNATAASTVTATKQPMTMAEQVASITASPTMSLSEQVAAMSAAGESNKQALQDYLNTYRTQIVGYSDAAKASIEVFMSALKGSMAQSQGVTDAAFVRSQVEFFGSALSNVPAFDVGTNYVPRDMIAQIHEGEAIVPKAYNPAANGDGNERLENLVETLTAELRVLQAIVNTGNTHARRTADVLDNVTEGGSNMRTIAV